MKRNFKIILLAIFIVIAPLLMSAQAPPHPNGGNLPGAGNGPVGGGAPIAGGAALLVALGAAYGVRKLFQIRRTAES